MNELEAIIRQNIANELYNRGYGEQRLGNIDVRNDWLSLLIVFAILYLVFQS